MRTPQPKARPVPSSRDFTSTEGAALRVNWDASPIFMRCAHDHSHDHAAKPSPSRSSSRRASRCRMERCELLIDHLVEHEARPSRPGLRVGAAAERRRGRRLVQRSGGAGALLRHRRAGHRLGRSNATPSCRQSARGRASSPHRQPDPRTYAPALGMLALTHASLYPCPPPHAHRDRVPPRWLQRADRQAQEPRGG